MNAADKFFWRYVNDAKRDYMRRMAEERIRACKAPESAECDGDCRDCAHQIHWTWEPDLPQPEYREFNSVCQTCGRGYLSEHGQDWTCKACRSEHELGEMRFWE